MEIVNIAKHKHTSIKDETRKNTTIDEVEQALIEGFQKMLNIRPIQSKLTTYEHELAERLFKEKYSTIEWNFQGKSKVSE
jgi:lipoate-protein ligase A